ncbi:unnamed protein product [Nezara viridula]|uniref:Uncharacterized protein n=1 Tax=Nezara viridula TaxID=85310 RepID=A0A9P0HG33_NEZVI|nr:unnamed protein product [Nezara viridula]
MARFHSELYTKCLEDRIQELAKNDLVSVFLERGPFIASHGFFSWDHSVFCRMLSVAVTWFFIIIQFTMSERYRNRQSVPT